MHCIPCSVLVLAVVIGWSWQFPGAARGLEVGVPLSTPRLTGLELGFPVGEATVVLEASLAYDVRGKVAGLATVDGVHTFVKGGIKRKVDAWVYTVTFKGLTEKVNLKVTGIVGTGVADVKYSGPRGKAKLIGVPVELQASVGSTSGELEVSLQVDPKGKITGTGAFTSGLGNDPPGQGIVKGKVTRTSLSVSFKSGKQKLTFKGAIGGEYFVGLLKVTSPPAKEKVESFRFPVSAFPVPPPDDDGGHEEEQYLFSIALVSTTPGGAGGAVNVNRVTSSRGRRSQRAYVDIYNNSGDTYQGNLDGIEFGDADKVPPARVGEWFKLAIFRYVYDLQSHRFTKKDRLGTFIILVGTVEEHLISGTWRFEGTGGELHQEGTWSHVPVPPPPEDPIVQTEIVHSIDLVLGAQGSPVVGSVLVYRTTRQSGAKGWAAQVNGTNGEVSYATNPSSELPEIPSLPAAPGQWFMASVISFDPVSGAPSSYGSVALAVEDVQGSIISGTWRLEDQGATLQSGTWSLDTDPVQMTEQVHNIGLDLPGSPAGGGLLTTYRNTRVSGATFFSAYVSGVSGEVSFSSDASVLPPIPALPSAPGSWFTIPVATYDPVSGSLVPFGSFTLAVGAASGGLRSGTWSVRDLGGAELNAGTWEVSL